MKTNLEMMTMKPWRVALAGLTLAVVSPLTWAAAAIQAITSSQQAGADVVRIELSEPLASLPAGFVVQVPPRIAIDLPGVTNSLSRNMVDVNQGNVRSVNVVQAGERTRLVLNLRQATTYRAQLQGNTLMLILDSANATVAPQAAAVVAGTPANAAAKVDDTVRFAENKNASPLALKDIDFRRGQDGAGRVVVELPNNQVGVDIKQQGQSLVVEFQRAILPDRLRKRFDVTDFGTPVQGFSVSQVGERVKLVVEPRGDWEHSAYQSDNQFVLEVRPRKVDPNNWPLLREALKAMGRADLIGNGQHHLIPFYQPQTDGSYQSARRKNSTGVGSKASVVTSGRASRGGGTEQAADPRNLPKVQPRKGLMLTQHTGLPPRAQGAGPGSKARKKAR